MQEQEYKVNYPIAFKTVDIAVIKGMYKKSVLMIRKKNEPEDIWRFPGGFSDVTDNSTEESAVRELFEETNIKIDKSELFYLGSTKIDDSRYKNSPHCITTSFYTYNDNQCKTEDFAKAGDDAIAINWIPLEELSTKNVNKVHHGLLKMLLEAYDQYIYYTKWENVKIELKQNFNEHVEEFISNSANPNLDYTILFDTMFEEFKTMMDAKL